MRGSGTAPVGTIWTVGHSTLSLSEFVDRLAAHEITCIADVRRFPGSRRYPHFNVEPLAVGLHAMGIGYAAFPELGGRRTPRPDSPHVVWRNLAFRGYADYMDTGEFAAALGRLTTLAARDRIAVMCSEGVWWRCHRALIADYLKALGYIVLHIMGVGAAVEHPYTSAASIVGGRLVY